MNLDPQLREWLMYAAIALGGYLLRMYFPMLPFLPGPRPAPNTPQPLSPSPSPLAPFMPLLPEPTRIPPTLRIGHGELLALLLAALQAQPPRTAPPADQEPAPPPATH